MRVVVYPHILELGGSQLNAIELAAAVRDLGHDVLIFGQPGALSERVEALGLEFMTAPAPRRRPSPPVMRELVDLVRRRRVDIVHGYEWTTALEAYWGPRFRAGIPAVATVMSMSVAPFVPHDLPLIVGTEQIAAHERSRGRTAVDVLEPPVDLVFNNAGAVDPSAFRRRYGIDEHAFTVVVVSRLAPELKLEGLLTAIDAVARLAHDAAVRLLIVGDGPSRTVVEERAAGANARLGRPVVTIAGALADPRPAYAAADVALGMGGSALRAMAFGAPVVVQGERGFFELVTPTTVDRFLWTGWYGIGDGTADAAVKLETLLRSLLRDPRRRSALGAYTQALVRGRFSLTRAAARQVELYERVLAGPRPAARVWIRSAGVSTFRLAKYELRRRGLRLVSRDNADDFNANPVAAVLPPAHPDRRAAAARTVAPARESRIRARWSGDDTASPAAQRRRRA